MLKPQRLEPLHDLAGRNEDEAVMALAEARKVLAQREAQLRELENYREPEVQGAAGLALLRNREAFRQRLAEAIRQQRVAVTEARQHVETRRLAWLATHQKTQVYGQLLDTSRAAVRAQQERRQQRDLDELSLRMVQARSAG